MKNRLNLDFSLSTNLERVNFVTQYLKQEEFVKTPPNPYELETIANYVLYGKDPDTGKNVVQEKSIQIPTKFNSWNNTPVDSLDELLESPGFNEASLNQAMLAPSKKKREVFSRTDARSQCPEYLKPTLEDLFHRIDVLELSLNYYELAHGKRKNPPREKLLNRFTPQEQVEIESRASHWNALTYAHGKHDLVELRREQYTIRDSFRSSLLPHSAPTPPPEDDPFDFDTDVQIFPLGAVDENTKLLFKPKIDLHPLTYSDEDLKTVSKLYWMLKARPHRSEVLEIDFTDETQVGLLFTKFFDTNQDVLTDPSQFPGLSKLLNTLKYYIDYAELPQNQQELLEMKMRRVCNSEIAKYLNEKYGRAYTPNYISTIFRQQIIPKVCDAARDHEEVVGFLFFPEEFKTCTCCGRTLLINNDNFMHRTRSRDGFSSRCKKCDSKARKKEVKGNGKT